MPSYSTKRSKDGESKPTRVRNTPEGPKDGEGALLRDPGAKKNVGVFVWRTFTHVFPAIVLGFVVDKIFKFLQQSFKILPLILVVIQIIVSVIILYIIEKYLAPRYAEAWLNATPGTLFVLFYFGVQFHMFEQFVAIGKGNGLVTLEQHESRQEGI